MADICGDNRFEIIAKAKEEILKATNIDSSPDEMLVLDNFLFRCWQMGWLKKYEPKDFNDELDEYLFENHQVKSGCCSSIENLKYDIAREVAGKMIEKFGINIQYVSQEERRKRMDEMYGVNLIKEKENKQ